MRHRRRRRTKCSGHAAFTGRSAEVDALRDTFFPIQRVTADSPLVTAAPTRQAILQAIRGLGGVGKTELAVQYVLGYGRLYPAGVFFLSADAATELELLKRLAMAVHITCEPDADADAMRRSVHRWFNEHEGWLLIVDNADDADALKPSGALSKALPPDTALGHVLITSRVGTEAFGSLGIEAPLTLGLLDTNAAELLLLRVAFALDDSAASDGLQSLSSEERAASRGSLAIKVLAVFLSRLCKPEAPFARRATRLLAIATSLSDGIQSCFEVTGGDRHAARGAECAYDMGH